VTWDLLEIFTFGVTFNIARLVEEWERKNSVIDDRKTSDDQKSEVLIESNSSQLTFKEKRKKSSKTSDVESYTECEYF
jgi:anti-sigma-K factor RskA